MIRALDWQFIDNDQIDFNAQFELMSSAIESMVILHCPLKKMWVNGKPWLTPNLFHIMDVKNKIRKEADTTDPEKSHAYRKFRNVVRSTLNAARVNYFRIKLYADSSSRNVWGISNEIVGKHKQPPPEVHSLKVDVETITSLKLICDSFAKSFIVDSGSSTTQDIETFLFNLESSEKFSFNIEDIMKAFSSIKHKTSAKHSHPYEIFHSFITNAGKYFCKFFNNFLHTGTFPEKLKSALTFPLYKGKVSKLDALSYRPISNISIMCKLFEKLVSQ